MSYDGICNGGPYDGKRLIHGRYLHEVAYERDRPSRSVPGMVTSTSPWIAFGNYLFHPSEKSWVWFAEGADAPTRCDRYELWIKAPLVTSQIARDTSR